jgi:PadR family transcriptional regulator PadR
MRYMNEKTAVETMNDKLVLELRRGILVLAALSQLNEDKYGYALMQDLAGEGLEIEQGTLYPLLRRLEEQELLESQWIIEGSRPRRYYRLSSMGIQVLKSLSQEWSKLVAVMDDLLAPLNKEA